MREEDEIRAAVIELARAQAAGEDIADALPHGEALATAGAAADGEVADDALDPEQARREAILAVLDVVRAASRESLLSCPCEWEAAGLVPPSMMPEDLEMAVYDALMEFGDPNGSRDAGDVEGPDAGGAPRRAANKHVKSAFSSSNGRPVGASPFKRKAVSADAAEVGTERSAKAKPSGEAECVDRASSATEEDVRGAGGCPDRASSAAAAMANASGISGGAHQASSAANAISPVGCRAERGLSERLSTTRKPAPEESQADSREPQFAHVQADGTLPHFVPERRLRLFNSLKALGTPAAPTVTTRLWGQITIDTELCRSCRMCTVFCPTGALTRFDAANDAFGVEHRSALCMQCRLCETICPEQAITVAEEVSADEFLSGKKFRFTMQPIGWNPGAEDSIASRMARFIKVDNLQEPQAKVKSFDTAARREYAQAREARRREIREQHSS